MMRIIQSLAVAAVAAALFAATGCSAATDVTLTGDDDGGTVTVRNGGTVTVRNGGTVTVRNGGTVTVELVSDPTTGYTWLEGSVPPMLEARGEPTLEPSSDASGSPGIQTLTCDAVAEGEGTLELEYARAFDSVEPEDTFVVVEE